MEWLEEAITRRRISWLRRVSGTEQIVNRLPLFANSHRPRNAVAAADSPFAFVKKVKVKHRSTAHRCVIQLYCIWKFYDSPRRSSSRFGEQDGVIAPSLLLLLLLLLLHGRELPFSSSRLRVLSGVQNWVFCL